MVEMTYVSDQKLTVGDDETFEDATLTTCFDTLLNTLNAFLLAYMMKTADDQVYRLSKDMLSFAAPWRLIHPKDWDALQTGLFMLHPNVPYNETFY